MKLQNVTLRMGAQRWEPVWNDLEAAPGGPLPGWIRGLAFDRISGLEIDGIHVEGFPGDGLAANSLARANLTRLSAARCRMGLAFSRFAGASRDCVVDGVRVWDTWGPGPGAWAGFGGSPSRRGPRQLAGEVQASLRDGLATGVDRRNAVRPTCVRGAV